MLVWLVVMLQVVEAILEDELVRLATMPTSSRCLSSRNMNSNKCVGLHVSNPSTVVRGEDMALVVVVQPLGRECTMTFRNQTFQAEVGAMEEEVEEAEEVIREDGEVEVQGDLRRHKLDLRVPLLPTLQLGRRMLVSRARTIVVAAEAAIGVSTPMLGVESQHGAVFTHRSALIGDTQ